MRLEVKMVAATAIIAAAGCSTSNQTAQAKTELCEVVKPVGSKVRRQVCPNDWAHLRIQPKNPGTRPMEERPNDVLTR